MLPPERILELNTIARDWFRDRLLESEPARTYAARRGLSEATTETWQLGYAPSGRGLARHLAALGWPSSALLAAGLVAEHDGMLMDRFWDRLVFPLLDEAGQVLAFAGRTLVADAGPGVPKYLNSPSTAVFAKSSELHGWPNLGDIRRTGEALIVEGHLDMLAMWQAGHRNVLALGGTALSQTHLERVGRAASRITLVLDADAAGERAAVKALRRPDAARYDVGVVELAGGKDPADLLLTSRAAMGSLLRTRARRWDHLWRVTRRPFAARLAVDVEARIAWKDAWLGLVVEGAGSRVEAESLLRPLAAVLHLPLDTLADEATSLMAKTAAQQG